MSEQPTGRPRAKVAVLGGLCFWLVREGSHDELYPRIRAALRKSFRHYYLGTRIPRSEETVRMIAADLGISEVQLVVAWHIDRQAKRMQSLAEAGLLPGPDLPLTEADFEEGLKHLRSGTPLTWKVFGHSVCMDRLPKIRQIPRALIRKGKDGVASA